MSNLFQVIPTQTVFSAPAPDHDALARAPRPVTVLRRPYRRGQYRRAAFRALASCTVSESAKRRAAFTSTSQAALADSDPGHLKAWANGSRVRQRNKLSRGHVTAVTVT